MQPIPLLSSGLASRVPGFALLVVLTGLVGGRAGAVPLPMDGVEEFKRLLLQDRSLGSDDPIPVEILVQRRRDLREAARQLPSLGEVARVLLLPEWGSAELSEGTAVPLDKVEAAVRQPDDARFQRDVENLVAMAKDNAAEATQLVAAEIKRSVRLTLLERLEGRIRFYLRSERSADRIAAANLVSEILAHARRQDNAELPGVAPTNPLRKSGGMGSRFLRQRLRELDADLQKATRDAQPQVQVAAVQALSELETDPLVTVPILRPLLDAERVAVVTRRATARRWPTWSISFISAWTRPTPSRRCGVWSGSSRPPSSACSDSDREVRRASLEACQKTATTLDDLTGNRRLPASGLPPYRPILTAVQKSLPELNRAARDSDAELRVAACHLLETLVLVSQKARLMEETPLPAPRPLPTEPTPEPKKGPDIGVPLIPARGARRPSARPSQWAAARLGLPSRPVAPALADQTPAATLGRPVKLQATEPARPVAVVSPVAFVATKVEAPPPPAQLEGNLQGTVESMTAGLSDADYKVRLAALDVLETFGDRAAPAIPALIRTLSDRNKFVRWAAARTLGRLAERARERNEASEVVRALTRLLNDREDISVRITVAYALELYGPLAKDAVPHLARVINRGDKEYIIAILHTLQGIGTDAQPALPNVAWILRQRSLPASVRVEAAQTLGASARWP